MVRIPSSRVPLFFAYKEQDAKSKTDRYLNDTLVINDSDPRFVLNFVDYLQGCIQMDCYSKYTDLYPMKKFVNVLYSLEHALTCGELVNRQWFAEILSLFQIECCFASAHLRTLHGISIRNQLVFPTIPLMLKDLLSNKGSIILEGEATSVFKQNKLVILGWLVWKYRAIFPQSCYQFLYDFLTDENCKSDSYARYLHTLLHTLYYNDQSNIEDKPVFVVYNPEGGVL